MLNFFIEIDHTLSRSLIGFVEAHPLLEELVEKIAGAEELKGMIASLIIWYLWFYSDEQKAQSRAKLYAVILTTVVSIAVGRALANFLPFRPRPKANESIMGDGIQQGSFFGEWSSMPSDHAVMFFALATGFFLISRKVGILALLHAAIIVCLPRILLGLHYLSDILAGAIIGVGLSLVLVPLLTKAIEMRSCTTAYPARIVYPVLFFVTFNIATMFNGVRAVGGIIKDILG